MKPNDQRGFVHKRIIGAVGGFLGGGPVGAVGGFVGGGGRRGGGQPLSQRSMDFRSRPCAGANRERVDGVCRDRVGGFRGAAQRFLPGGATGFTRAGEAVMGQYGVAMEPEIEDRMVRLCLPGMILGKDGLCYNRGDISNKERRYPKGTRPLGTPGEMACLRKAASFGRRMENTVKRMQKIGVLSKPKGRSTRPQPKRLTAGDGVRVVNVE